MRRLATILIGCLVIAIVGAAIYTGVRAAYGAFRDYYYVSVDLPRAGQQVQLGTDVRVRGVRVGKVSDIELVDRHARLTLQIEEQHKVPKDVLAVVTLKTFLGSKFVDLRFDPDAGGPYLVDGDEVRQASVGPELEDALDDGTAVLAALDPEDVAILVTELARAANGHGDDIARGLDANARLSDVFASTLEPQIKGLEDFKVLFGALDDKGDDMNALAAAVNEGVPVYASAEAHRRMARALDNLVPFADHLADLLIYNRSDWDRMMDAGDRVLATIAARPDGLGDMVHGLYIYVFKLGGDIAPDLLPDGSAQAGFSNFIGGNDSDEENRQICTVFPPEDREKLPICSEGKS